MDWSGQVFTAPGLFKATWERFVMKIVSQENHKRCSLMCFR